MVLSACVRTPAPPALEVRPGQELTLELKSQAGFVVNDKAPSVLRLLRTSDQRIEQEWGVEVLRSGQPLTIRIPEGDSGGEWALEGRFYLCQKTRTQLCTQVNRKALLRIAESARNPLRLDWNLEPGLGSLGRPE